MFDSANDKPHYRSVAATGSAVARSARVRSRVHRHAAGSAGANVAASARDPFGYEQNVDDIQRCRSRS